MPDPSLREKFKSILENELDRLFPTLSLEDPLNALHQAIRHSILSGGKRVRPLLTLLIAHSYDIPAEKVLGAASAIECIHTYSMIHDDLPAMDDDDFRRGIPTVHRAYGEAEAILAGDLLLTRSFEIIATDPHLNPDQRRDLIACFATASGANGMIGGQFIDIRSKENPGKITLKELERRHLLKTGALILASVDAGCCVAGAPKSDGEKFRHFGRCFGLAFQVVDDILDVTSPESKHGRNSDLLNETPTYISLMGLEAAQNHADQLLDEATAALHSIAVPTGELVALVEELSGRIH
ncbi:MAG: polyprenyl synthetase family protein [Chlamydiia bacterium]|nr:polyprenyl synthetase family protein [Chlamydiia bacterium]